MPKVKWVDCLHASKDQALVENSGNVGKVFGKNAQIMIPMNKGKWP